MTSFILPVDSLRYYHHPLSPALVKGIRLSCDDKALNHSFFNGYAFMNGRIILKHINEYADKQKLLVVATNINMVNSIVNTSKVLSTFDVIENNLTVIFHHEDNYKKYLKLKLKYSDTQIT